MSDRHGGSAAAQRSPRIADQAAAFLNMLQDHAPTTAQLIGLLAVVISAAILLLVTGVIIAVTFIGLILFAPLIVISSPIWVPVGSVLFLALAGFVATCAFGVAAAAVVSWGYSYFKGFHPVGSGRVDYARGRIYDTASHVKDYAREYGGYLHSKVKDAAPGA